MPAVSAPWPATALMFEVPKMCSCMSMAVGLCAAAARRPKASAAQTWAAQARRRGIAPFYVEGQRNGTLGGGGCDGRVMAKRSSVQSAVHCSRTDENRYFGSIVSDCM